LFIAQTQGMPFVFSSVFSITESTETSKEKYSIPP